MNLVIDYGIKKITWSRHAVILEDHVKYDDDAFSNVVSTNSTQNPILIMVHHEGKDFQENDGRSASDESSTFKVGNNKMRKQAPIIHMKKHKFNCLLESNKD